MKWWRLLLGLLFCRIEPDPGLHKAHERLVELERSVVEHMRRNRHGI